MAQDWNRDKLSRSRPPETIRAFERPVTVLTPMGIPHACPCTWVSRYGGMTLKFRNASCPAGYTHG